MNTFEKAKIALRKHLLENKEQVIADLKEMRKKSEGNDIFKYTEQLSEAFSLSDVNVSVEIDTTDFIEVGDIWFEYLPPNQEQCFSTEKASDEYSEAFFVAL